MDRPQLIRRMRISASVFFAVVAVALCVASGVVDAGIGVEAAALQFGLHFVPLVEENYFLACLGSSLRAPAVGRLRPATWRSPVPTSLSRG